MFKYLYKKLMNKFFIKILMVYTLIIFFVLSILATIILGSIYSTHRSDAINDNIKVVQDTKSFIVHKTEKVETILELLYLNKDSYSGFTDFSDIFELLRSDNPDKYSETLYTQTLTMNKFLKSSNLFDNSILDIVIVKIKDWSAFIYTNRSTSNKVLTGIDKKLAGLLKDKIYGARVIPTISIIENPSNISTKKDYFTIATIIRTVDFKKNIGVLLVNFSSNEIISAYSSNYQRYNSDVLVLTASGTILFDSSGRYKNKQYPFINEIKKSQSNEATIITKNGILSMSNDNDSGFIVVSEMHNAQIFKNYYKTRNTVFLIMFICVAAVVFLSFMSISLFSKRIETMNTAMNSVKDGDLSTRVEISKSGDEINQIALNFNLMCDNLNDYINKVYISELKYKNAELKQKGAELYALQSQVNPHFLYNTLEAIRMRAVTYGQEDVSQMICILATLFRNSIKKEMIVTISDELDYCKSYLELYNIRYGPNLEINFEIDSSILDYGIIKHLLQPLIENSIVHGINPNKADNKIDVTANRSLDAIRISVCDNGKGMDELKLEEIKNSLLYSDFNESESVGIINVHQRIKMIYGDNYGLEIQSKKDLGTIIFVNIPIKTVKELEVHVQGNDRR